MSSHIDKNSLWCMLCFIVAILHEVAPKAEPISTSIKLKIVTWNVGHNTAMDGSFTDEALDEVLGLENITSAKMPDIYAIGLQENCWMCNQDRWAKVGNRFTERINDNATARYQLIGVQGTRQTNFCEIGCSVRTHGTAMVIVIAKESYGARHFAFRHISGCSSKFIPNKEKGVAAIKYMLKDKGKTICFGALHLDTVQSRFRRQCLKKFFTTADEEVSWRKTCNYQFLFGDFSTKTGNESDEKGAVYVSKRRNLEPLKLTDEFSGSRPYGTTPSWNGNLLSFINFVQPKTFKEKEVNFVPTYAIIPAKQFCRGKLPCYRKDRPMSWTDRIIYTNGKCDKYEAIHAEYADHFPVFAEFTLNL